MKSKASMAAAGLFLALVGAFILYLATAPDYVPPPVPQVEPPVAQARPTPPPLPVLPPQPEPEPEPEADLEPEPEPRPEPIRPPDPQSIGDYGSIEGIITRVTVPLPRIRVTATPDAASGDPTGLATASDARGKFKLPRVPAGRVMLSITDAGIPGELKQEVFVAKGETTFAELKLPGATATIEGTVYAGGVALPNALVEIKVHGEEMLQERTIQSADGHYVADNLLAGVVGMIVTVEYPPGERKTRTDSFAIQEGEVQQKDVSFSLPAAVSGTLTGIDQDAKSFIVAVTGVVEEAEAFASPENIQDRIIRMTNPDSTGYYRMEGLDPGTYTIIAFSMRITQTDTGPAPLYEADSEVVELVEEGQVTLDLVIKW